MPACSIVWHVIAKRPTIWWRDYASLLKDLGWTVIMCNTGYCKFSTLLLHAWGVCWSVWRNRDAWVVECVLESGIHPIPSLVVMVILHSPQFAPVTVNRECPVSTGAFSHCQPAWGEGDFLQEGTKKGGVPFSQDSTTSVKVSHSTVQACVETVVWKTLKLD